MGESLRVLIVEDSEADTALLLHELERSGYDVVHERVQTADEMKAALERTAWHAVLSDYTLPTFSGPRALDVLKASGQDLPFIIVSGTIGEEVAVLALKAGAHDFLIKGRLARLVPALARELRDADGRRERHLLEQQLRQSQKMEAIGQLAGGIAHDFNNLLTAILGYSELLRERVQDMPDILADVDEITKAGERAASLTGQLLAFSRKQMLQPQVLDLQQIVADVENMLRRIIGEDVQLDTTSMRSARVQADRSQIEQVILNLVINARDAMPRGGHLTIRTGVAAPPAALVSSGAMPPLDGWVSLAIADTGAGMSPEVEAQIFEPFFTTKAAGQGTGLGLSTVYGIVRQSGGFISVDSRREVGTTFTIYLPAVQTALESVPAMPALGNVSGTETILLVEDDHAVRGLIRRILTTHGYVVLEAAEGVEALTVSSQYAGLIQLLLTDLVMPELTGPDLAQRIVATRPNIGVLYISGFSSRIAIDVGQLSGGASFLHKPFTPGNILKKVRTCLDRVASAARLEIPTISPAVN
jgi:two-component system cell cycle sensor histidine kinase/response regulator CckA